MKLDLSKVSAWISGALAFGWLATVAAVFALPGGHPPSAYFIGGAVVLLSFVMAPIGAGMALLSMRRSRRARTNATRLTVSALWLNTLLLLWAIFLWFFFVWEASRR